MMDLEYYEISVPDRNDSIMRVNLDEVYYNLRLTWNAYGGFWMLSIYDAEMNIILSCAFRGWMCGYFWRGRLWNGLEVGLIQRNLAAGLACIV